MSPPEQIPPSRLHIYTTDVEGYNNHAPRVDSPMDIQTKSPFDHTGSEAVRDRTGRESEVTPQERGSSNNSAGPNGFMFVACNPVERTCKAKMQGIRKHVMLDYLGKARLDEGNTDKRIKRSRSQPPGSPDEAQVRSRIMRPVLTIPTSVPQYHDMARPGKRPRASTFVTLSPVVADRALGTFLPSVAAIEPVNRHVAQIKAPKPPNVMLQTTSQAPVNNDWSRTSDVEIVVNSEGVGNLVRGLHPPRPQSLLGTDLNPFHTMPKFADPTLNTEELKWSCSRRFGSPSLTRHWVPELVKTKHAFLSAICISSAHDDIMRRALKPLHERSRFESSERTRARIHVMSMIQQAMDDPQMKNADGTIIAVLHLLTSEIMGCNDPDMEKHQRGLHVMIRSRGGLQNLGVNGQLADMLTITMYMVSIMREGEPHTDYAVYANQKRVKPPTDLRPIPESPVYCRSSGFHTIKNGRRQNRQVLRLLDKLRLLTNSYARGSGSSFISPLTPVRVGIIWDGTSDTFFTLYNEIWQTQPAEERHGDFDTMQDEYVFEAVRLVGLVYAFALVNDLPFSKAASFLGAANGLETHCAKHGGLDEPRIPRPSSTTHTTACRGCRRFELGASGNPRSLHSIPIHIRIQNALSRTNISECWGHMAGVLFWVVLVAGACANSDSDSEASNPVESTSSQPCEPTNQTSSRSLDRESEDARKWLAAIAVRCSILLSFEYGGAILETLKRMAGVEQALARADADRQIYTSPGFRRRLRRKATAERYGPHATFARQLGFQDRS